MIDLRINKEGLKHNIEKAKETLGWRPERNLSHMIWDAYQWHRDHPDGYGDKRRPGR